MSSSGADTQASFPLPPPVFKLMFVDPGTGMLTQVGIEFLTKLWAGMQGGGGIIDQLANKLDKHLEEGGIFVGGEDGIAHGVLMSGDASIDQDGEVTVSRVRVQMVAGEDLSGHRAVFADSSGEAHYPAIAVLADGIAVVGITTGAIVSGDAGPVQIQGNMSEVSWTWTPGQPVYVGDGGVLTQSVPSGAYVLQIAIARTATEISIGERYLIATP